MSKQVVAVILANNSTIQELNSASLKMHELSFHKAQFGRTAKYDGLLNDTIGPNSGQQNAMGGHNTEAIHQQEDMTENCGLSEPYNIFGN